MKLRKFKRGDHVKCVRFTDGDPVKEWLNKTGLVVSGSDDGSYPVRVKLDKADRDGNTEANFNHDELVFDKEYNIKKLLAKIDM